MISSTVCIDLYWKILSVTEEKSTSPATVTNIMYIISEE